MSGGGGARRKRHGADQAPRVLLGCSRKCEPRQLARLKGRRRSTLPQPTEQTAPLALPAADEMKMCQRSSRPSAARIGSLHALGFPARLVTIVVVIAEPGPGPASPRLSNSSTLSPCFTAVSHKAETPRRLSICVTMPPRAWPCIERGSKGHGSEPSSPGALDCAFPAKLQRVINRDLLSTCSFINLSPDINDGIPIPHARISPCARPSQSQAPPSTCQKRPFEGSSRPRPGMSGTAWGAPAVTHAHEQGAHHPLRSRLEAARAQPGKSTRPDGLLALMHQRCLRELMSARRSRESAALGERERTPRIGGIIFTGTRARAWRPGAQPSAAPPTLRAADAGAAVGSAPSRNLGKHGEGLRKSRAGGPEAWPLPVVRDTR